MKRFLCAIALLMLPGLVHANAEPIPATVIQDLIDVAAPGDEIVVAPGTYHGSIVLREGITLRSEKGDAETIIDGQGVETVVTFSKESALIGFTLRNGQVLIASKGNFIGVFENTLESYGRFGIFFEGGSGVIAHNYLRGSDRTVGIVCFSANPLVINNVIEGNKVGFQWQPHLIPTLIGNLFRNNTLALNGPSAASIVLQNNLFDGNSNLANFGELPEGNEVRTVAANEFVLARGQATSVYRDLMDATYEAAVKDHPIIVYDLHQELGVFDAITLFPWANFVVSASAIDTKIEAYQAYDWVADQPLNAELFVEKDQRPSVRVHNPELVEKMRERYVLENVYVHPASYVQEENGRRVFRRMTNVSQIEVVIPSGYRLVSSSPEGILHAGGDRPFVSIHDIGVTQVEVVMEPVAFP